MSATNIKSGKFITFEGIDGAGKSSHIAGVVDFLRRHGLSPCQVKQTAIAALSRQSP